MFDTMLVVHTSAHNSGLFSHVPVIRFASKTSFQFCGSECTVNAPLLQKWHRTLNFPVFKALQVGQYT